MSGEPDTKDKTCDSISKREQRHCSPLETKLKNVIHSPLETKLKTVIHSSLETRLKTVIKHLVCCERGPWGGGVAGQFTVSQCFLMASHVVFGHAFNTVAVAGSKIKTLAMKAMPTPCSLP